MLDVEIIAETLENLADPTVARKRGRQIQPLRGIRGTEYGEIARVAAAVPAPTLEDEDRLRRLFMGAYEDGLVAIGLLATLVPEHPTDVLDIARSWGALVDDLETADALGWLVLGPSFAASGGTPEALSAWLLEEKGAHACTRRMQAAMGLSWMPTPVQGPAAAPLRERFGEARVQFVDAALSPLIHALCTGLVRDEIPAVRKCLRRILKLWVKADPAAVVAWEQSVRGGIPKMLSAESKRARGRV